MYTAHGTLDRESVVERYGPMVRRVASQLAAKLPANVDPDDLAQAGMIGLLDAMTRYEPGHGAQFESFAMQRVRGAMLDELRGSDWLPRSVRRAQRTIEQAIHAAEQKLQRAPGKPRSRPSSACRWTRTSRCSPTREARNWFTSTTSETKMARKVSWIAMFRQVRPIRRPSSATPVSGTRWSTRSSACPSASAS